MLASLQPFIPTLQTAFPVEEGSHFPAKLESSFLLLTEISLKTAAGRRLPWGLGAGGSVPAVCPLVQCSHLGSEAE